MPDPKTRNRLRGLRLSAGEIQRLTGWPNDMVLDYLSNRQNAVILSTLIDIEIDQKLEEVPTDFLDGSIPYVENGFLVEDNANFQWDAVLDKLIISNAEVTNDLEIGGEITSVDAIQLDLAAAVSVVEGQQAWNVDDGTIDVGLPGGVVGQQFEETYFGGKNATGSDVSDGTPVMFAAPIGVSGKIEFQLAIADGTIPSEFTMGLTTQDIANGEFGKITWFGKVRGIDTTGTPYGEVWADGDLIYVSATTAGDLTNVKPNVPNRIILVAAVVVAHSNGTLQVRPTWKSKLVDLDDVNGTALTVTGQFLSWDQTNGFFDFSSKMLLDDATTTIYTDFNGGTPEDLKLDCGTNKTLELIDTCWRDELHALNGERLESPASNITIDNDEGSLVFDDGCTLVDFVTMNVQINHDWKLGTDVYPHIHWWQTSSDVPNWLIQYRWQKNGGAKTTVWTDVKYDSHAFTYVSGTLNQITSFGAITPPVGYGLSDILQIRILRDTDNDSTLFAGADPLTGDVSGLSADVHIEVNTLGSRQIFTK